MGKNTVAGMGRVTLKKFLEIVDSVTVTIAENGEYMIRLEPEGTPMLASLGEAALWEKYAKARRELEIFKMLREEAANGS